MLSGGGCYILYLWSASIIYFPTFKLRSHLTVKCRVKVVTTSFVDITSLLASMVTGRGGGGEGTASPATNPAMKL